MKLLRKLLVALFLCFTFGGTALAAPLTCTVTGTVYKTDGVTPYAGGYITFRPTTTQTFTPDTVAIPSIRVTLDVNGAIPAGTTLVQGERLLVSVGSDAARAITVPSGASCPVLFSDLYGAVQVPPPAGIVHSVTVSATGDTGLSVSPTTGDVVITFGPALAGVHTNGSDTISNFSVNNVQNVKAWGAVSTAYNTTTGSINAASSTLTVANATGLVTGGGVIVVGAGAAPTITAPTISSVTPTCWSGGLEPAFCTAGPSCTPSYTGSNTCVAGGATTYNYKVVALDALGGYTTSSAQVSTTVGNATLSATQFNRVVINGLQAGAVAYAVYRNANLIGAVQATQPSNTITTLTFDDIGQTALGTTYNLPNTAPASAGNQFLETTIANVVGTTLTLATPATNTVSGAFVAVDDSPLIRSAISGAISGTTGGSVFIPPGTYNIGGPVQISNVNGLHIDGGSPGRTLLKAGLTMAFLPVVRFVNDSDSSLTHVLFQSQGATTPPISAVEFNVNSPTTVTPIRNNLENVSIGNAGSNGFVNGVAWTAAPTFDQNNEQTYLNNVNIANYSAACLYVGHSNSLWHKVYGGSCSFGPIGVLFRGGGMDMFGTKMNLSYVQGRSYDFDLEKGTGNNMSFYGVRSEDANGVGILRIAPDDEANWHLNLSFYNFSSLNTGTGNDEAVDIAPSNSGTIDAVAFYNSKLITGPMRFVSAIPSGSWEVRNSLISAGGGGANAVTTNVPFYQFNNDTAGQTIVTIGATLNENKDVSRDLFGQCNDVGTVAISTTLSFTTNNCQRIATSTTGLTYTFSTTNVRKNQVVEVNSYITGAIAAGPLWATSSGAIKWAGGVAPVSSNANGLTDIIRLKWDGTNWQEISRSMGNS